jgi:hypothetical protein
VAVKCFEPLERGVDVAPILAEIERQLDAWVRQTGRRNTDGVQRVARAWQREKARELR